FQCQIDTGGYSACTSPKAYTGLTAGSHTFDVRATDSAGNTDSTPATYTWTIDTTAPDTTITAQPSNPSNSTSASFSFTSTETGSIFQCQIDSGGYSSCTSPASYTVAEGSHTFDVKTTDAAGNTDPTPATYTWTIDVTAPTIPTGLSATVISDTRIDLSWTAATDANGVSGYKIYRGGTYLATSTTTAYSDTTGSGGTAYTYTVSAYDAAGNESAQSSSAGGTTKGTNTSGAISGNTTWTLANSPYILSGSVLVNAGVTLTIEPGVTVKFDSGKSLQIDGTLIARGTSSDKITFTSNKSAPAAGDWGYILFSDTSTDATYDGSGNYTGGSVLEFAVVEYAGGVAVNNNGAVRLNNAHPLINYCTIRNNGTLNTGASGINAYVNSNLKISNNTIQSNSNGGINLSGGAVGATITIANNTITNNTASYSWYSGGGGVWVSLQSGTVIIFNNTINDNATTGKGGGVHVQRGTVTISKNIVKGNTAAYSGGGIYVGDFYNQTYVVGMVDNNIISSNTAYSGGGIYVDHFYDVAISISNNIISNNTASDSAGGLYYNYYSVYSSGIVSTISNNHIIYNTVFGWLILLFNTIPLPEIRQLLLRQTMHS
ncbi:MAG: right-handed parallel beta-helix repeat-containing protein, partial [Deltaproteobacteria bacterium]|nr:right-handed parallel beta-helix repeat-containing protein [Deltaproteobacteria bacterium]